MCLESAIIIQVHCTMDVLCQLTETSNALLIIEKQTSRASQSPSAANYKHKHKFARIALQVKLHEVTMQLISIFLMLLRENSLLTAREEPSARQIQRRRWDVPQMTSFCCRFIAPFAQASSCLCTAFACRRRCRREASQRTQIS